MSDRYEILTEIGRGGFATVYRARDAELDRLVALKELHPYLLTDADWLQRFRREAQLIASLNHPRIVRIYDIGQAANRQFLVMHLVDGPNVDQLLTKHSRLPWLDAIDIISSIAEGLEYAHDHGILHRDLKPANILIDSQHGILLSDFGLAKLMSDHSLSQNGSIVGTPHYIAPEIWEGQPATLQTDIYSLGCIFYELLVGEKLFAGETAPAVMMAHFQPSIFSENWPAGIPAGVSSILNTALARHPSERYDTVGQLIQALTHLTEAESSKPGPLNQTAEAAGPASSLLQATLLGGFSLYYDDRLITEISQLRQQSLLAYLMLNRHAPQGRQHLSFLFWPDSTEQQARTNLRYLLHQLRQKFPHLEQYLQIDSKTLHWRPAAPFSFDVAEFERLTAAAGQLTDSGRLQQTLEQAIELYRGELFPGCYDEWLISIRERLNQIYIDTLERLIDLLEAAADYRTAIAYATRLLSHDRVYEMAYRRLMSLYALSGDRASALRVYHNCVSILEQELGVEPGPNTRAIYHQLLNKSSSQMLVEPSVPIVSTAKIKLVGRDNEWQQIQTAWQSAQRGPPHLVLIAGEAGIGKTRLAEEMLIWAKQHAIATAQTRSYAAEGRLAYAPITHWLRSELYQPKLAQLDDVWLTELARLLPEILTEHPDLPHPLPLTENWQRQRLFEALAQAILLNQQPAVLQIDDLQWCDREALEWLHFLLRFDLQAPLLLIGTVRVEEVDQAHPLITLSNNLRSTGQLIEIDLNPLDKNETVALASQATSRTLTQSEFDTLYAQCEGNPLFVVETVRAGLTPDRAAAIKPEADPALPLSPDISTLPPKVRAVLQTRLAQLSKQARELANLTAVVGRSFTYDILVEASNYSEDEVVRGLDELWQRRIIREQGSNEYDFSHDRLREAAYAELSAGQRRLLHRRVAHALEALSTANMDDVSAQLAAHYDHAGQLEQAIHYYHRSGEIAHSIFANGEAITYLQRGLALLKQLPQNIKRDKQELDMLTFLGASLVAVKGYAADIVRESYYRAYDLCRRIGELPSGPVLRGLALSSICRQEFEEAAELGHQLLRQAEHNQDSGLDVEAHYVLGVTLFWQGRPTQSKDYLEQAIVKYQPKNQSAHIRLFAQDPLVICQCRLAYTLWCLGYPAQAEMLTNKAVELATTMKHPHSLAYVLSWAALMYGSIGNIETALKTAQAGVKLSREHQLSLWVGHNQCFEGWARARLGEVEMGLDSMNEGIWMFQRGGSTFCIPYFTALLAEQEARLGHSEEALPKLSGALDSAKRHGENWCLPELSRLKGEVLQQQGAEATVVEPCYLEAIDIARTQQAKSFELRATMSLCRLWQQQGKIDEAHQMLTDLYSWFSEGFDTKDLLEAKALLKTLS